VPHLKPELSHIECDLFIPLPTIYVHIFDCVACPEAINWTTSKRAQGACPGGQLTI